MKLHARSKPDNAWTVSVCPPKELFAPREVEFVRTVTKSVPFTIQVPAKEARENGVEVDPGIPDEQIIDVDVEKEIESEKSWMEVRLCYNGRSVGSSEVPKRKRRQKIRVEIASALESPFSYLQNDVLVNIVRDEQERWKSNNMAGRSPSPVVLVLLGVEELEGESQVYSKEVFIIEEFSLPILKLIDGSGKKFSLELELGLMDDCYVHNFIMFMPSNVEITEA